MTSSPRNTAESSSPGAAPPILTFTLGGEQPDWETERQRIVDNLLEIAGQAQEAGAILAVEPHVGGALDTPEKAVWLMQATSHPHLKLNFDISHFHLQGMDMAHCMDLCLPYVVHAHVKDSIGTPSSFKFLLPGQGDLDYGRYFALLEQHDYSGMVAVEVSGMVFNQPGYNAWDAARWCADFLIGRRAQHDHP